MLIKTLDGPQIHTDAACMPLKERGRYGEQHRRTGVLLSLDGNFERISLPLLPFYGLFLQSGRGAGGL